MVGGGGQPGGDGDNGGGGVFRAWEPGSRVHWGNVPVPSPYHGRLLDAQAQLPAYNSPWPD